MATKTISLCDYVLVTVDGEETRLPNSPRKLWEFLGWDIDNDPNAKECASLITQELFYFRFIDISALTNHRHKVTIEWKFNE